MKRPQSLLLLLTAGTLVASTGIASADPTGATGAGGSPAIDTARNDRTTPTRRSEAISDHELTQKVRKAVSSDKSLSKTAHNIKIDTVDGVVTLRGPVKSQHERSAIAARAKNVAGVKKVDNKLEIASKETKKKTSAE